MDRGEHRYATVTAREARDVIREFDSSPRGLDDWRVRQRLAVHGYNKITSKSDSALVIISRQFFSPFNYLLLIAAFIAAVVHEYTESAMIVALAAMNVGISFFQEFRAYRAVVLLRRYIPSYVTVMRDGIRATVNRERVVPGDILILERDSIVAADARIIEGAITVDESTLTGEAAEVAKSSQPCLHEEREIFRASNMAFAGTRVIFGSAHAVVIATGNETVFSGITEGTGWHVRVSTYEQGLVALSKNLLRFVVATLALIFAVRTLTHGSSDITDFFIFCITLIVALVPEALPVVVTFALSRAALAMAKNHVVVKRLSAIEDLGDIEVLCTDKTGTLTELSLAVDSVVAFDKDRCLLYSFMDCLDGTNSVSGRGAFDNALWSYAGESVKKDLGNFVPLAHIAFDPSRMLSTILVKDPHGRRLVIVKGAPEVVLALSKTIEGNVSRESIIEDYKERGRDGKRVLAVAYKEIFSDTIAPDYERDLGFVGFIALVNPVKKGVDRAVALAIKLGITIKMITGDSAEVAAFVARSIGLKIEDGAVVTGQELAELSDAVLRQTCSRASVFARIDPALKARIVAALQEDYKVGFLGEGVNDVPALKKANVALVVQEASDVAREASDIILLRRDLNAVVAGVKEGRATFCNINKYVQCTLSGNFSNYYSLAIFSLIIPFLPMLPSQILLINVLTDIPFIAIASDTIDADQLRRPERYVVARNLALIILLGCVGTLGDIVFFSLFRAATPQMFRSLWFIFNITTNATLMFSLRTQNFFLTAAPPSAFLVCASLASVLVGLVLPYTALGQEYLGFVGPTIADLAVLACVLCVYGVLNEFVKLRYVKYTKAWVRRSG